ncbi:Z1 domain-containing protein [Cupriavidus sp. SZY C1]|uniref:Z1 domain-containing protein n=1 Tax=Cupriavidus sp. SZY C1 TaxID=3055037 RepID=UPI0028BA1C48|nr:Z1 domain-containing protein [Cupriavidus sp. SZY C1]MDT6964295.1 Z1 domain-containing protein [Cupriavidus sp. SZY C1]
MLNETNSLNVLKVVQMLLQEEQDKSSITPAVIEQKISLALMLNMGWQEGLDREWVVEELIRRFSVWLGKDTALVDDVGHKPWLTPERKANWRYWQRYREWQEAKLPWSAIDGLDASTDEVLGLLEDPLRVGSWDRRGLVVGHVQSGKTGNYTGLISKAADAGYKIIVVLAGLHNNLRSQTQMRLDEGFLGYATSAFQDGALNVIGVGVIDGDPAIRPNYATNRSDNGDFSAKVAKNLGITPEQRPWLFVIKKNKSVLQRLLHWINNHVANASDPETGRRIVTNLPLLVIDDEADHASVDTGEQLIGEDGVPDSEHQPTAINSLIRKILHAFTRKAYVGYTATPFANIFIHERGATRDEGPDLFPSSFIVNLGAPSNYIGPARVFGLAGPDGREGGLPLVREISDHCSEDGKSGWMPVSHKATYRPHDASTESGLPESLNEAIDAFILACAIRQSRGQGGEHSSMLVHVTRFNAVQQVVHECIESYVRHMRQRVLRQIGSESILARLKELWLKDFVPTSEAMAASSLVPIGTSETWCDIVEVLPIVLEAISVRMINGTAKDALDYADSAAGLKVIAVGGDKLARGLTLEGLCTSYFLRASRMYDTLMQMGRWFGYRPGYLDVCRLYTTSELVEWFEHIADAAEELREEFDQMAASSGKPIDFGLKVKSHPVLMVTSRLKMRSARTLYLSFSGSVVETVTLFRDPAKHKNNLDAFRRLTMTLGPSQGTPVLKRNGTTETWTAAMWKSVSWEVVVAFLQDYETHPEALKVNSRVIAEFIAAMAREGELTSWTVAVIGGSVSERAEEVGGQTVPRMTRRAKAPYDDRYSIGRLLSPRDEGLDIEETAWLSALNATRKKWHKDPGRSSGTEPPTVPSGISLRAARRPETALLLLYLLDPEDSNVDSLKGKGPTIAFGISFPGSDSGTKVEYKVNNVLWEQQYGASE